MSDPGLRYVVSPTTDWKDPKGPFACTKFQPDGDGLVERTFSWSSATALLTLRK